MGYALPGAVIVVGVLVPLAWLDRAVGHAAGWLDTLAIVAAGLIPVLVAIRLSSKRP